MSAVAIYFADPGGHELKFIVPLFNQPKPHVGVNSWEDMEYYFKTIGILG